MDLLSADEARDLLRSKGVTAVPNSQTLKQAPLRKVFSGRTPEGSLWKVHRETEDGFIVDC